MASTSISGWSGAGDRTMALTATVANASTTKSTLTIKVDISGGESGVNYYDSHLHVWYVMDSKTYEVFEDSSPYSDHEWYATRGGSKTWTFSITRASSAKTVRVYIEGYAYVHTDKTSSVDVTIPIEATAPTITQGNISSVTANSFKISASSDVSCNTWQYRLYTNNSWGSWTTFKSGSGTSASATITGLSPNTSYTVQIRATKVSNSVVGTSANKSATTLGYSILNSVTDLEIDTSATLKFNATFYSTSYTNYLTLAVGSTNIFSQVSIGSRSVGTANLTFALANYRSAIYSAVTSTSATCTLTLTTKSGNTTVGTSSKTFTISVSSASAPTINTPTYLDANITTVNLTQNNQKIIQRFSNLEINGLTVTLKNGASLQNITFTDGTTTKTATSVEDPYEFGAVNGNSITITATDSRGYTATTTLSLDYYEYQLPTIDNISLKRINSVEENVTVSFSGYFTDIFNNTIQSVMVRWEENGTWQSETLTPTISGSSYSVSAQLTATFDPDQQFLFNISVGDRVSGSVTALTLPKGKPLMWFTDGAVGFHTASPQYPVDVVGAINTDTAYKYQGNDTVLIVESGTNNGWTYRKYSDGTYDAFKRITLSSVSASTAWGNLYRTATQTFGNRPSFDAGGLQMYVTFATSNGTTGFVCSYGAISGSGTGTWVLLNPSSTTGISGYLSAKIHSTWA